MKRIIPYVVIGILAFVLIWMQWGAPKKPGVRTHTHVIVKWLPQEVQYVHDTPKISASIPLPVPVSRLASKDYDSLKRQYDELVAQLYTLNIYKDTVRQDSSFVEVTDTVIQNNLYGRSYAFNLRCPTTYITTETKITLPTKRQVYFGGGITSISKLEGISISAGLLYKNRKENIAGINVGVDNAGKVLYGFNAYWKLSLNKHNP